MSDAPLNKTKPRIQNSEENKIKSLEARFVGPCSNGNMPSEIINPLEEVGVDQIKSKLSVGNNTNISNTFSLGVLPANENTGGNNFTNNLNKIDSNQILRKLSEERSLTFNNGNNNSNKSNTGQSGRRKTPPKKAERKSKIIGNYQIDYLTTKLTKSNENSIKNITNSKDNIYNFNVNLPLSEDEQYFIEGIEFSSKNVRMESPLFNNNLQSRENNVNNNSGNLCSNKNKNNMDNFLNRARERDKEKEFNGISPTPILNNNLINGFNNIGQSPSLNLYSNNNINNNTNKSKNNSTNNVNNLNTPNNFSLNNLSNLQTPDSNFRILKKIQEENEKLTKELIDHKKSILDRDKEIEKLKSTIQDNEESIKNITIYNKQIDHQIQNSKISFIKYLKELEEIKRQNKRKWLNEQEYRLGKAVLQRVGQTTIDIWEEGEEVIKLTNRMRELEREKIEIESQKSNLTNYIKKRNQEINNNEINQDELNSAKHLLAFKLANLQKEEIKIRENFEKIHIEKTMMILERKRLKEEESSRFGNPSSKERFPVLANRYLILSLLGKGGYSEVYKAFDLDNHMEVACKIHQLNPQWSDSIKENYIRHTIRENQIHKQIDHSKIVKHYDTIEIDNNSFCTVLEICSGPDLHTYLKIHRNLSEKEARAIISQILSGLEYMNKLQKKIIHYDLKPQNIIFHNMEVKISDFGLAKIMENNVERVELTSQGVGTYWYLPPECFDNSRNPPGISQKVDIWSLGVILYELLFGIRPFGQNCTQDKILKDGIILNAKQVIFPLKPVIGKQCKEFIEKCLVRNQESRMDVYEALEHEFIKTYKKNK